MLLLTLDQAIFVSFCAIVVLAACAVLAAHRDYHSGFLGTIGLGILAASAYSRIAVIATDYQDVYMSPTGIVFWLGAALFFGNLLVSFLRRAKKKTSGTWYPNPDAKAGNGRQTQKGG